MAPVRRYLRITKYSVLECRIYLDDPALAQSWLLHPRNPVLPRVLESIRPLVLPKLVEERERARKKGAKNKGAIKDVLVEDDFEVSLFLTETDTRHSLLYKHRKVRDKTQTRLVSNSTKLTGATLDAPIDVEDGGGESGKLVVDMGDGGHLMDDGDGDVVITARSAGARAAVAADDVVPPTLLREDGDDDAPTTVLRNIPDIRAAPGGSGGGTRRSKRQRQVVVQVDDSDGQESLFGSDGDDDNGDGDGDGGNLETDGPPAKRSRGTARVGEEADDDSKKQKLAMDVLYEGFAIYGRVLCLVIKKRVPQGGTIASVVSKPKNRGTGRTGASAAAAAAAAARPAGHAAMENWIASTQAPPEAMEADAP